MKSSMQLHGLQSLPSPSMPETPHTAAQSEKNTLGVYGGGMDHGTFNHDLSIPVNDAQQEVIPEPAYRLDQPIFPDQQLQQPGIYVCNICTARKRRFLYVADAHGGIYSLQTHIRDKHQILDYRPHVQWAGFLREADQALRVLQVYYRCAVCPSVDTTSTQTIVEHLSDKHGQEFCETIQNEILRTKVKCQNDGKVTKQMKRDVHQALVISSGKGVRPLLVFDAEGKIRSWGNVNNPVHSEDDEEETLSTNSNSAPMPMLTAPFVLPHKESENFMAKCEAVIESRDLVPEPVPQYNDANVPATADYDSSGITENSINETSFTTSSDLNTSVGFLSGEGKLPAIDTTDPVQLAIVKAIGFDFRGQ